MASLLLLGMSSVSWGQELIGSGIPDDSYSGPDLVPAAFGVRTDAGGHSWDLSGDGSLGRVGSTMVNHGLVLEVNGGLFESFQPLMTPDGRELVVFGKEIDAAPGVEVQRRIRLDEENGVLRYVEFFYNGSASPQTIDVSLRTNFSGNFQTFLSSRGRTEPRLLSPDEGGIVVLPGSGQASRAFLFSLAELGSRTRPSISAPNRFTLVFQYRVEVGPGETASLLHGVSQVPIPQDFGTISLDQMFAPSGLDVLEASLENDWIASVRNLTLQESVSVRRPESLEALIGIKAGPKDILAMGPGTRLLGSTDGAVVSISGDYGQHQVPMGLISTVIGKNGSSESESRLILRDGQILTTEIDLSEIEFVPTGGTAMPLDIEQLDRLVLSESRDVISWRDEGEALLVTQRGDRLKIASGADFSITGVTPWGEVDIGINELNWLGREAAHNAEGWVVELKGGMKCRAYLKDDPILVTPMGFDEVLISPLVIESVFVAATEEGESSADEMGMGALVYVNGDQTLVGTVGNRVLPVVSNSTALEILIREARRAVRLEKRALSSGGLPEDAPLFEIERWNKVFDFANQAGWHLEIHLEGPRLGVL
ncbi:MAG: hypothetical protein AAGA96_14215, partial [Verrucomicrobiota bacterium]